MKDSAKQKIIVIVGPTASGKSDLAVELAKKYRGEIISADSRQIYKKLDIGTAKVTKEEMGGIPHHLIDIIEVNETYSAQQFKKDAQRVIEETAGRGNTPIVVGGTFFYVDMLLGRAMAPKVSPNKELREELEKLGVEELYKKLSSLDPERAETIDRHNKRRLIRALEIVEALGKVPKQETELMYKPLMFGLQVDKDTLRKRFLERAKNWQKQGFLEEIRSVLENGVTKDRLREIGFEYQLGLDLLEENITKKEFEERFVQKNWQYAKRQLTWLKRDKSIIWISPSEEREIDLLVENFLRR